MGPKDQQIREGNPVVKNVCPARHMLTHTYTCVHTHTHTAKVTMLQVQGQKLQECVPWIWRHSLNAYMHYSNASKYSLLHAHSCHKSHCTHCKVKFPSNFNQTAPLYLSLFVCCTFSFSPCFSFLFLVRAMSHRSPCLLFCLSVLSLSTIGMVTLVA